MGTRAGALIAIGKAPPAPTVPLSVTVPEATLKVEPLVPLPVAFCERVSVLPEMDWMKVVAGR